MNKLFYAYVLLFGSSVLASESICTLSRNGEAVDSKSIDGRLRRFTNRIEASDGNAAGICEVRRHEIPAMFGRPATSRISTDCRLFVDQGATASETFESPGSIKFVDSSGTDYEFSCEFTNNDLPDSSNLYKFGGILY